MLIIYLVMVRVVYMVVFVHLKVIGIRKVIKKAICIVSCTAIISGCAPVEVTQAPELSHLANQCFETKKDGFLFTRSCGDVDGFMHDWTSCHVIQVPGGCLPSSELEYKREPSQSQKELRVCLGERATGVANRKAEIKEFLPAGTRIRISRIVRYTVGLEVTCWLTRATLQTGEHAGLEVELPSCSYHQPPLWIEPAAINFGIPHVKPELLEPCANRSD